MDISTPTATAGLKTVYIMAKPSGNTVDGMAYRKIDLTLKDDKAVKILEQYTQGDGECKDYSN